MSTMATLSVITTALSAGAQWVKSGVEHDNAEAQEKVSHFNAQMARDDAARVRAEYAMNAGLKRASARKDIASAANVFAATGNVGSSADAAMVDAYLNLSSDLGAMKYQYDNTAIKYLNEAKNHDYNAKISNANKKGAALAGYLNVATAIGAGALDYYKAGGSFSLWPKKVTDVNGNVLGKVGGYGTYQP